MLRDKMRVVQVTVPAMTSTKTCTIDLEKLGIPLGEVESLKFLLLTSGNYTVAKKYNTTTKKWTLVVTATGSVSANTVITLLAQAVADFVKITVAALDD